MKKFIPILIIGFLIITLTNGHTAEKAPDKLIQYVEKNIIKWGVDPIIVAAVKEQNAKKMSLDDIKAMDEKWKKFAGIADYMKAMMESKCGQQLRKLQKPLAFVGEIFVMDNQGANVAMTDKTSDYWQGDEDKFIKSFNKGKGAIHYGDVEFDDSAQAYLVQASFPVKEVDPETKKATVIGAITVGINIDTFEEENK